MITDPTPAKPANEMITDFARTAAAALPCRVRHPDRKGKFESGVICGGLPEVFSTG